MPTAGHSPRAMCDEPADRPVPNCVQHSGTGGVSRSPRNAARVSGQARTRTRIEASELTTSTRRRTHSRRCGGQHVHCRSTSIAQVACARTRDMKAARCDSSRERTRQLRASRPSGPLQTRLLHSGATPPGDSTSDCGGNLAMRSTLGHLLLSVLHFCSALTPASCTYARRVCLELSLPSAQHGLWAPPPLRLNLLIVEKSRYSMFGLCCTTRQNDPERQAQDVQGIGSTLRLAGSARGMPGGV